MRESPLLGSAKRFLGNWLLQQHERQTRQRRTGRLFPVNIREREVLELIWDAGPENPLGRYAESVRKQPRTMEIHEELQTATRNGAGQDGRELKGSRTFSQLVGYLVTQGEVPLGELLQRAIALRDGQRNPPNPFYLECESAVRRRAAEIHVAKEDVLGALSAEGLIKRKMDWHRTIAVGRNEARKLKAWLESR